MNEILKAQVYPGEKPLDASLDTMIAAYNVTSETGERLGVTEIGKMMNNLRLGKGSEEKLTIDIGFMAVSKKLYEIPNMAKFLSDFENNNQDYD